MNHVYVLYLGIDARKPALCKTPTSLYSYIEKLVYSNFLYSQLSYYTAQRAKIKGAHQTRQIRRLVYAFVVRM